MTNQKKRLKSLREPDGSAIVTTDGQSKSYVQALTEMETNISPADEMVLKLGKFSPRIAGKWNFSLKKEDTFPTNGNYV